MSNNENNKSIQKKKTMKIIRNFGFLCNIYYAFSDEIIISVYLFTTNLLTKKVEKKSEKNRENVWIGLFFLGDSEG